MGYGIFWGIFPLWGWQLAICIPTGYFFKLNVPLVIIAANISLPPMIPFILYASFMVGSLLVSEPRTDISPSAMLDWTLVGAHFYQYALGAVVLAVVAGVLIGFMTYLLLVLKKNNAKS